MNKRRLIFWALPFAVGASLACSRENESSASTTPPGISPVSSSIAATPPGQLAAASNATPAPAGTAEDPVTGEPREPVAQAGATAEPREPTAQTEGKRRLKGDARDPAKAVIDATDQLSDTDSIALSPAQKSTIQSLREKLGASKNEVKNAFNAGRADIANEVRSGSIDQAKVNADEAAITRALNDHMKQEADALNTLHATLDHQARSDVVAAARAEHKAGVAEAQGTAESRKTESAKDRQKRQLDRMTSELNLDATQQRQVAALLESSPHPAFTGEQRHDRFDTVLNSFQRDNFDAKTSVASAWPSPAPTVHEFTQQRVAFLQKLLPILHPDQRDKLASKIENGRMDRMQGGENMPQGDENMQGGEDESPQGGSEDYWK